jgi:hypothetical protein
MTKALDMRGRDTQTADFTGRIVYDASVKAHG